MTQLTSIPDEINFIDEEFLNSTKFVEESKNLYSKLIGKDLDQNDLKFHIEYKPDWNSELGQCYEFRYGDTILLLAYCIDKADFISVLKTFNV